MGKNKFLRTCICCREAKNKEDLYRFTIINNEVVLDYYKKLEGRGFYVCKVKDCFKKLNKKLIEKNMKKENFHFDKEKIYNRLKSMLIAHIYNLIKISNKSGKAVATVKKVLEIAEKISLIIISKDLSINSKDKIEKYFKEKFKIEDLFTKEELGRIFNKSEVGVVGIVDLKLSEKLKNLYIEYLGV